MCGRRQQIVSLRYEINQLFEFIRQAKVPHWSSQDESIGVLKALDKLPVTNHTCAIHPPLSSLPDILEKRPAMKTLVDWAMKFPRTREMFDEESTKALTAF